MTILRSRCSAVSHLYCVSICAELNCSWLDSSSIQENLCTEGVDLAHHIQNEAVELDREHVAFSQYPRPSDSPQVGGGGIINHFSFFF